MSWVILGLIVLALLFLVGIYNRLVVGAQRLQERVRADRRAAHAPLRPDSEPGRDRQGLHQARARDARSGDPRAQCGGCAGSRPRRPVRRPRRLQQLAGAENTLTGALGRLFAVAEAYPDLKANQNMMQLSEELTSTENKVAFARQAFNDAVMSYNTTREVFPNNFVAGAFGFAPAQLLEIESAEKRAAPKVSFT